MTPSLHHAFSSPSVPLQRPRLRTNAVQASDPTQRRTEARHGAARPLRSTSGDPAARHAENLVNQHRACDDSINQALLTRPPSHRTPTAPSHPRRSRAHSPQTYLPRSAAWSCGTPACAEVLRNKAAVNRIRAARIDVEHAAALRRSATLAWTKGAHPRREICPRNGLSPPASTAAYGKRRGSRVRDVVRRAARSVRGKYRRARPGRDVARRVWVRSEWIRAGRVGEAGVDPG